MTNLLGVIAWCILLAVAGPLIVFCAEVAFGLCRQTSKMQDVAREATVTILIPAHNEEVGVAETVRAVRAISPLAQHILVVADNCTDQTAAIAEAAGAEVIQRFSQTERGKGYALAHGRDHLASTRAPDVVIVLDADCRLKEGSVERLAAGAMSTGRPIQAVNLLSADRQASPLTQVSSFAMVVKNLIRSRGMQRMGGAALLTGTGMAFPWQIFAKAHLATGSIVEDLALGIELTKTGHPPALLTTAHVRSASAAEADAMQQRERWEHGFLATFRQQAWPTLKSGIAHGSLEQILLGLHLLVPPLALLLLVSSVTLAALGVLALLGASAIPALVLLGLLGTAVILVFLAWLMWGREYLTAKALFSIPFYIIWKVPLYARFLLKPRTDWNRTPRG